MQVLVEIEGVPVSVDVGEERKFKTGSTGYMGWSKLDVNGKAYHVGVTLVEVGSRPKKGRGSD